MASVALVPRAEQDIRTALNVLALNFSLNDKVVEELLKVGVRNLEEFRFLFEDEAKVGAFVAKIGLGDEATIQTARLRRAWTATRVYFSQVEQDRSKVALADLDSLLEESELRDAKQAFWRRYRLRFPAEVHPSDAVVSRVSRELSKRMLCLFNVWKVRSLQFQLGTSQKKRRLGDGLFTEEAETEESYTADCDTYLNKLHTLLIAYSLAGCQPHQGADLGGGLDRVRGGPAGHHASVLLPSQAGCLRDAGQQASCLAAGARLGRKVRVGDQVPRGHPFVGGSRQGAYGQSGCPLAPACCVRQSVGGRACCHSEPSRGGPQARIRIQVPARPGYQWQANREADEGWPAPLRRIQQGHLLQQELRQWGAPLLCDPARRAGLWLSCSPGSQV